MKYSILTIICLLAACAGEPKKDYAAVARCRELGFKEGTPEYDRCLQEEKSIRMMREQREEYERMKQEDRDWKMRRY